MDIRLDSPLAMKLREKIVSTDLAKRVLDSCDNLAVAHLVDVPTAEAKFVILDALLLSAVVPTRHWPDVRMGEDDDVPDLANFIDALNLRPYAREAKGLLIKIIDDDPELVTDALKVEPEPGPTVH